jgi:hypothetical protein
VAWSPPEHARTRKLEVDGTRKLLVDSKKNTEKGNVYVMKKLVVLHHDVSIISLAQYDVPPGSLIPASEDISLPIDLSI